jgi:hypothetical protein
VTTPSGPGRVLLLAGSVGPERLPVRQDPREPRWFEPLHVRDARRARDRMANQVAAGADVIVAPTWQTHRRALVPVGETRQARAWTSAAVRVAREAVEVGLERRAEGAGEGDGRDADAEHDVGAPGVEARPGAAAPGAEVPPGAGAPGAQAPTPPPLPRPVPLVAASLPALDEISEPGVGRLLPRQAAGERDYRAQAGVLADQEPDVLLVEGQTTITELRMATDAAAGTGLPVWVAVAVPDLGADDLDQVVDALGDLEVAGLLLWGRPGPDIIELPTTWGGLVHGEADSEAWLDAGALLLGMLDGATPDRLSAIRAVIDQRERATVEAAQRVDDAWDEHVRRAAAMAQGGAALWIHGPEEAVPAPGELPTGFTWLVVNDQEAYQVPEGRSRLIVDRHGGQDAADRDARLLAEGGILAGAWIPVGSLDSELRVLTIDDRDGLRLAILRREG